MLYWQMLNTLRRYWGHFSGRLTREEMELDLSLWVLNDGPEPVLVIWDYRLKAEAALLRRIVRASRVRRVHILVRLAWRQSAWEAERIASEFAALRLPQDRVVLHFLANTEEELKTLQQALISLEWVSSNAFVDESVFRILPSVVPSWDAIYDARLSPFKRHELAAEVDSLACIVYQTHPGMDREHGLEVRRRLNHAHWFNRLVDGTPQWMEQSEMNAALNQCRVGLCLSAVEGAMLASIQYLLAGLPVVTTPSKGGRDVFFDPAYALTVEPEPAAVAAGVREMINRNVPREEIRAKAIQEMERHRARLVAYVARITGEQESSDPLARWHRWAAFNSGSVNVGQLLEQLRQFR